MDQTVPQAGAVGRLFQFVDETANVFVFGLLLGSVLKETAIQAFCFAKRNVDVCRLDFPPSRPTAHDVLPDLLRLGRSDDLSAQSGVDDALSREGVP